MWHTYSRKESLFVVVLGWHKGLLARLAFGLSILLMGVSGAEDASSANLPLSITLQPANAEIAEGESAVLAVETAGGTGRIGFTWYHLASGTDVWRKIYTDESRWPFIADPAHFTVARQPLGPMEPIGRLAVPGANRCELTVHGFGAADEGAYRCETRDNLTRRDGVSSETASVRLSGPLAIRRQPADVKAYPGDPVCFDMVVSGGSGSLHYEWMFDADGEGPGLAQNVGTDAPRFTIDSAGEANAGTYICTVRDSTSATPVVSRPAVLDVQPKVAVAGPVMTPVGNANLPIGRCGDTPLIMYEKEQAVSFSVTAAGGYPPYAYQWWRGTTRVEGATEATYTIPAPVEADSGGYCCVVTDATGGRGESEGRATLAVARPLAIVSQPLSSTGFLGKPFALSIVADGGYGARHYQWRVDEDGPGPDTAYNIPGSADLPTYPILALKLTDMASYSCVVSDSFLDVEISDDAVLLVEEEPALPMFVFPGAALKASP